MLKFIIIGVVMSALNGEAARNTRSNRNYAGGYAGSYAGAGSGSGAGGNYVGGYTGGNADYGSNSYAGPYDYDDYGGGSNFGIIDPYLFHQQLTNQILAQNHATQHAITSLITNGNAYASADATIANDDIRIQQQIAAQQAYHDNLIRQNRYRPSGGSSSGSAHRYAPSYAHASGSIGPNGHRQTAYINPANPAQPNIVNRFGGGSSSGSGNGFKGVSVSSYSTSNGDGTSRRGAHTTINDNGKVTSYSVHS